LPRLTLMLYELSSPTDGDNLEKKAEKLRAASQKFLDMAYDGIRKPTLGEDGHRPAHARLRRRPA
jgi:hypothetical protein